MDNKAMERKLESGEAQDVSSFERTPEGYYVVPEGTDLETDFCDSKTEEWIWSIGRNKQTGVMLAATAGVFYQSPQYECLWLR